MAPARPIPRPAVTPPAFAWVVLLAALGLVPASFALAPRERTQLFDQVWQLIAEKYYDPALNGVDWTAVRRNYRPRLEQVANDEQLYLLLKEMTGELHDAHTRFHSPGERVRIRRMQASSFGIGIANLEGTPVVVSVEPGSEAAQAGVQPGMIVTSVDGVPFAERLEQARRQAGESSSQRATAMLSYHWVLAGEPGTRLRLGLQRSDGSHFDVAIVRRIVPLTAPVEVRTLASGYGYIRFGLFSSERARQFRQALRTVQNTPGLVIDLRGNPGGQLQTVTRIAGNFFSRKVSFGKVITRSGGSPSLLLRLFGVPGQLEAGHPGRQVYSGPVVLLVNETSGSGAELFSAGMQENRRATVVGRPTCGCVLASVAHKVKGGGEVDVSEFAIVTSKNQRLEGVGVTPDVVVPLTLDDLRRHRDAALGAAVDFLRSSGAAASAYRARAR